MSLVETHRELLRSYWGRIDADPSITSEALSDLADPSMTWVGMDPVGTQPGVTPMLKSFWQPFRGAFETFERDTHILMAGRSNGRADGTGSEGDWATGTGYFTGRMTRPVMGIPATNAEVRIRWGEFVKIEGGRIVYAQFMVDIVDWCEQIGHPILPPPRGVPSVYPAPTAQLGVDFDPQGTGETMALGRALIYGGLNTFDETDLESMGMRRFFHPNLKWYGPGGIGACLSLAEFEERHQQPWLVAFPDRKVQDLESLFADGPFVAGSGLAGVVATHSGPYLGHAATGRRLEVSGLDYWLRVGDRFTENWVFVDMIRLFDHMGIDLLARLKA